MDTLGHLLALYVTPADQSDRAQVEQLAGRVQAMTGQMVELAWVDQGCTGSEPAAAAAAHGIALSMFKRPDATRGFVLLRRRWVIGRSFAWTARFQRLARDYERLASMLILPHAVDALSNDL